MKKCVLTGAVLASVALAAAPFPVTVNDDVGEVTLSRKPTRIVAAHPISLELLLALGVQPAGYAAAPEGTRLGAPLKEIPKYSDLLKSEPIYVGNPLNLETTAALKPDLILSYNPNNADVERQMRRIAPTMLFNYAEKNGWQRAIVPLGKALGKEKRAAELLAAVSRQEQQARTLLAPAVKRGSSIALFAIIGQNLYSFGADFPPGRQLQRLGFDVASPVGDAWKAISAETILTARADRALLLTYDAQPQVKDHTLSFMKRGRYREVHTMEPDSVARFTAGPLSDIQMLSHFVKVLNGKGVR